MCPVTLGPSCACIYSCSYSSTHFTITHVHTRPYSTHVHTHPLMLIPSTHVHTIYSCSYHLLMFIYSCSTYVHTIYSWSSTHALTIYSCSYNSSHDSYHLLMFIHMSPHFTHLLIRRHSTKMWRAIKTRALQHIWSHHFNSSISSILHSFSTQLRLGLGVSTPSSYCPLLLLI